MKEVEGKEVEDFGWGDSEVGKTVKTATVTKVEAAAANSGVEVKKIQAKFETMTDGAKKTMTAAKTQTKTTMTKKTGPQVKTRKTVRKKEVAPKVGPLIEEIKDGDDTKADETANGKRARQPSRW